MSFFATLECELIERRTFRTKAEARLAIFDFIEGFSNPHRRHSGLSHLSPVRYEEEHRSATREAQRSSVHDGRATPEIIADPVREGWRKTGEPSEEDDS